MDGDDSHGSIYTIAIIRQALLLLNALISSGVAGEIRIFTILQVVPSFCSNLVKCESAPLQRLTTFARMVVCPRMALTIIPGVRI